MTKILFLALGDKRVASSRGRIYSYLPYLKKAALGAFVMNYTPSWQCKKILSMRKQNIFEKAASKLYSGGVVLFLLILAPFFNIVYIQKVALSRFTVEALKVFNRNIIFDFDDAIFMYQDITYLLKNSVAVIVSNSHLRYYAAQYNPRVHEAITPVNRMDDFEKEGTAAKITIGWLGSSGSSKYIDPLLPVFKTLRGRFTNLAIDFMGIDGRYGLAEGIKATGWSLDGEKKYLGRIDIGIMPLTDDEWSKGKGGYKLLQYMAAGVPCVASPVGINKDIVKYGVNGFLASTPQEWTEALCALIENPGLRKKMGEEGRRIAQEAYSYEINAPRLITLFNEIAEKRRHG